MEAPPEFRSAGVCAGSEVPARPTAPAAGIATAEVGSVPRAGVRLHDAASRSESAGSSEVRRRGGLMLAGLPAQLVSEEATPGRADASGHHVGAGWVAAPRPPGPPSPKGTAGREAHHDHDDGEDSYPEKRQAEERPSRRVRRLRSPDRLRLTQEG